MKRLLLLSLLAAAALGVAWWLGSSEQRGAASAMAPAEPRSEDRNEAAQLRTPANVPPAATESVATVVSPDSTRTPSAVVAPAPTFALRGTVRDERDVPVDGCQVVAFPRRAKTSPSNEPERRPIHTVAAPGGRFAFEPIEPGAWFVHAERGERRTDYAFVEADGTDTPIELRLVSSVRVAGVVLDPDGRPVAGGHAIANSLASGGKRIQDCDGAGRFEFPSLAGGPIVVHALAEDWAPSEEQRIELAPGGERTDLVLHLRRGARLTGVVLDDDAPVARRKVVLAGDKTSVTETDVHGRFAFEGLPPGAYIAAPAEETAPAEVGFMLQRMASDQRVLLGTPGRRRRLELTLAEGETREIVLDGSSSALPAPTVLVRGTVLRRGVPCSEASVEFASEGASITALTDGAGRFALPVASSGALTFRVAKDETSTLYRREIPPGGEVALVFELPTAEIVGSVVGPGGREVRGAPIFLEPDDEGSQARAWTDASGRFALRGILPGSYVLTAGDYGRAEEEWAPAERHVTIRADEHLELELALLTAGQLHGTVRTLDGTIFPGAEVLALAPSGRVVSASCDSLGAYELGSLVPGRVRLLARTEESCSAWRDVELRAGESVTLDLELAPAVKLEIETVDERGAPVAARVWIEDEEGHKLDALMAAGPTFEAVSQVRASLPPGNYQVVAWRSHAPGIERQALHLVGPGPERVRIVLAGTPPGR